MAELYGSHTCHKHIPQDDRLLGLLVIAEEENRVRRRRGGAPSEEARNAIGVTVDEQL